MSDCESSYYPVFLITSKYEVGYGVGESFVCICGGRQSVMFDRRGLCSMVSKVGARERIVTIWVVVSIVAVFVVCGDVGGRGVWLESARR